MQHGPHQLSLKLLERCPACKGSIPRSNIQVINETEHQVLAHMLCPTCSVKHLAAIVQQPNGIIGNAVPTDLTYHEILASLSSTALTEDDVLGMYTIIHSSGFITSMELNQ